MSLGRRNVRAVMAEWLGRNRSLVDLVAYAEKRWAAGDVELLRGELADAQARMDPQLWRS